MASGDDSAIHLFHTLWLAVVTGIGAVFVGIVKWNWNRLVKEVDGKADKESLAATLERIEETIVRNEDTASRRRHEMANSLQEVVGTVSWLKGYIERQDRSKGGP